MQGAPGNRGFPGSDGLPGPKVRLSINVTLMWLELHDDDDATVQSRDLAWVHVGADPERSQTQMSSLMSNPPCGGLVSVLQRAGKNENGWEYVEVCLQTFSGRC